MGKRKSKGSGGMGGASKPMVSIAGIRGVVGDSLRLDEFVNYAQAFMAGLKPRRVVIGGDTRLSRQMLRHLVFSAAIASGIEALDLGIVPTPTVGLMVKGLKAGGGIAITASHNPAEWNALKFFGGNGSFLTGKQFRGLLSDYEKKTFHRATIDAIGCVKTVADPIGPHLKAVLAALPVEQIRRRKFKVALDACNGAGLALAEQLFDALGVRAKVIFADQHRKFERKAEPLPENLARLKRAVREFGADVGFALDPDADRLAIVDETGRAIGEERTIVIAADTVLTMKRGPVVVNLSTTRAVDDVAAAHGVKVARTPIGEAHVVEKMKALRAAIGGEGNGGVIYPPVHSGRDAATGIGLVLARMSRGGRGERMTLSEINATIPEYVMIKDKIALADRAEIGPALKQLAANLDHLSRSLGGKKPRVDGADGWKISFADRWLHVRASGTEPIMRLFAEAPRRPDAEALVAWARQTLK